MKFLNEIFFLTEEEKIDFECFVKQLLLKYSEIPFFGTRNRLIPHLAHPVGIFNYLLISVVKIMNKFNFPRKLICSG